MSNSPIVSIGRRVIEEVFNKGHLNVLDELFAPNVKFHDSAIPHQNQTLNGYKDLERKYSKAFPGKTTKIDDIFATDDKVVIRWTTTGTQKGELQGIAASNKPIKITGITIYHVENNKVTEVWQNWDRLALLEQIGEIRPSEALHSR